MVTLFLNNDVLRWDCDALQVSFNEKVKRFDTLWELEEYLGHTHGVQLVNEEALVESDCRVVAQPGPPIHERRCGLS